MEAPQSSKLPRNAGPNSPRPLCSLCLSSPQNPHRAAKRSCHLEADPWVAEKRYPGAASQAELTCFPVCVLSRAVVSNSATPRTVARQAPLSMRFPRREYWSGLPFSPPGDLPDPGMEAVPLCLLRWRQILYHWATKKAPTCFQRELSRSFPLFTEHYFKLYQLQIKLDWQCEKGKRLLALSPGIAPTSTLMGRDYHPHFIDRELEAQGDEWLAQGHAGIRNIAGSLISFLSPIQSSASISKGIKHSNPCHNLCSRAWCSFYCYFLNCFLLYYSSCKVNIYLL